MNAVDVGQQSDVEIIEHLDFEPLKSCEVDLTATETCPREAAWVCIWTCCNRAELVCDHHRGNWVRNTGKAVALGYHFRCEHCGTATPNVHDAFDWIPIGGVS
ncbi:hypothetical protein SCB71_06475 [Herbiconiux sp. KACC 21604]|uniref:hypothetical protein n=1 Tax=unclassified Herbiconiux TaxID=2618217 RepID=UPI00149324A0|nr:hypothetical protein [Herbiconiux sp. SALV-R1]QJU52960.1 hypothetical protein HL652_04460 [Herbiconiux sp. SALV-R1]WPO87884.1 hypothetical protein SCB71_06475 [Herbiconiux sp. KACC 21604]